MSPPVSSTSLGPRLYQFAATLAPFLFLSESHSLLPQGLCIRCSTAAMPCPPSHTWQGWFLEFYHLALMSLFREAFLEQNT